MQILMLPCVLRLELTSVVKHVYGGIRETFKDFSELSKGRSESVQIPSFQPARVQNTVLFQALCRTPPGTEKRVI